jgi:hypothetical protein
MAFLDARAERRVRCSGRRARRELGRSGSSVPAYLHGSGETETAGRTDTYDITGGDVFQVIDWAQKQAGGKLTYAVALVVEDTTQPADERQGLVWLLGRDGNDVDTDPDERTRHQRMLSRRAHPVGVPDFDAVPAAVFSPYTDGSERRWL